MTISTRNLLVDADEASLADALSVFSSELGWIGLVGADGCALALTFGHDSPVGVRRELQKRLQLPDDVPEQDWDPNLRHRLQSYAAGEAIDFSDVEIRTEESSSFRKAVRSAVRSIEYGSTITYGQLAQEAGSPRAARAVGSVMATNPVPLIIPCHRVIGAGGRLGGYSARTGLTMKRRLLEMEQGAAEDAEHRGTRVEVLAR